MEIKEDESYNHDLSISQVNDNDNKPQNGDNRNNMLTNGSYMRDSILTDLATILNEENNELDDDIGLSS